MTVIRVCLCEVKADADTARARACACVRAASPPYCALYVPLSHHNPRTPVPLKADFIVESTRFPRRAQTPGLNDLLTLCLLFARI